MPQAADSPRRPRICWLIPLLLLTLPSELGAATVRDVRMKMGSRFELTLVADDRQRAWVGIESGWAEIDRIESLISDWRENTEIAAVNRNAGLAPVPVSPEVFALVRRALKVSALTDGAFDVSFGGVGQLWDFKAEHPRRPDPETVRAALRQVGWEKICLDEKAGTVFLSQPGMRIGFGASGKGYAADRVVRMWKAEGFTAGIVDASGDMLAFGTPEDDDAWEIGIAHPRRPGAVLAHVRLADAAIATSGDYENFVEIDGVRYGHIFDPRSGWPAQGVQSVTVISPDAELADALATGVFVLGVETGLALIDRLRAVQAIVIDAEGLVHFSRQFENIQPEHLETP